MTSLYFSSANFGTCFQTEVFDSTSLTKNYKSITITQIDNLKGIRDILMENVSCQHNDDGSYSFLSKDSAKELPIFGLVDFKFKEDHTLMEVFQSYDGQLLAYNHKRCMDMKTPSPIKDEFSQNLDQEDLVQSVKDYIGEYIRLPRNCSSLDIPDTMYIITGH